MKSLCITVISIQQLNLLLGNQVYLHQGTKLKVHTGCPPHQAGFVMVGADSEKFRFKVTSYILLSMMPWDSGYKP